MGNDISKHEDLPGFLNDINIRLRRTERRPELVYQPAWSYATVPDSDALPDSGLTPPGVVYIDIAGNVLWRNEPPTGWVSYPIPPSGSQSPVTGGGGGTQGPPGPQGPAGPAGPAGPGIAAGGLQDQILAKASTIDFDTKWINQPIENEVLIGPADPGASYELWFDTDAVPPTLYARVGGAWVEAGSASSAVLDEVFVGPVDPLPVQPTVELWYDTDDPSTVPYVPQRIPRVSAIKSDLQSCPHGANTAIMFDSAEFDTDNFRAGNTSRITIPSGLAGVYMFGFSLHVPALYAAQLAMWMAKNGNSSDRFGMTGFRVPADTTDASFSTTSMITMNAGDFIEIYFYHNNIYSSARNVGYPGLRQNFWATYIGVL